MDLGVDVDDVADFFAEQGLADGRFFAGAAFGELHFFGANDDVGAFGAAGEIFDFDRDAQTDFFKGGAVFDDDSIFEARFAAW